MQTIISIVAVAISFIAVVVSMVNNHNTHKRYIKSIEPLLSFKLIEIKNELYLKVINSGKSAAKDIIINVIRIENNGTQNELRLDMLFDDAFELYPEESTQGRVAICDNSIGANKFPKINLDIKYKNGVTKKLVCLKRTVIFTPAYENKIYGDINIDMHELNNNIKVMAKANLRTANYLDGCQVAPYDELNILANRSLHDDLQSIYAGNKETTVQEREKSIKNSI